MANNNYTTRLTRQTEFYHLFDGHNLFLTQIMLPEETFKNSLFYQIDESKSERNQYGPMF